MEVILEAEDGIELLEKLNTKSIDVLLLDLWMPKTDRLKTCIKLNESYPDIKILVLTHLEGQETIRKVINLNIQGYFIKNAVPHDLKGAILQLSDDGFT